MYAESTVDNLGVILLKSGVVKHSLLKIVCPFWTFQS